jgi:hypothetical protein
MRIALVAGFLACSLAGCAASRPATAAAKPPASPAGARPATTVAPVAAAADTAELLQIAGTAQQADNRGDPDAALVAWRRLRPRVPLDGDLELALAIDEARTGNLDSAAVRLAGPALSAAAAESLPVARYQSSRARQLEWLIDGTFAGWHWYVWRARSEVAAARGRWEEATIAARRCVAARPMSGKEWLLLAVTAGRAGLADEARAAAKQAATLDPGTPEALYLDALWTWKVGHRVDAQAGFRAAVAQDSSFRPAVVGLLRSRMPGSVPDSLPTQVLTGPRAVGMLTTRAFPKLEDDVLVDQVPILATRGRPAISDSALAQIDNRRLLLWLYVDEQGGVPLAEVGWYPPGAFPTSAVSELLALIPSTWHFLPANVKGVPCAYWADVNYAFTR